MVEVELERESGARVLVVTGRDLADTERTVFEAELAGRLRREDAVVGRDNTVGGLEEAADADRSEMVELEEGGGRETLESGLRDAVTPVLTARPWA